MSIAREVNATPAGVVDTPPKPFTTDGCSMWPDGAWKGCCVEHDKVYWRGGGKDERRDADIELMACVVRNGHPFIALLLYVGVRMGGHPWWPVPWRWGYGWHWPRGYRKAAHLKGER